MRKIVMLAAMATFTASLTANGGRQPGQAVTVCDQAGAYFIVEAPGECPGATMVGTITVVGENMLCIDLQGKNLIMDAVDGK